MTGGELNGFTAATAILKWLRAYHGGALPPAIDLDLVRWMLPETPLGQGVREIKPPMPLTWAGCDGALVRNPYDTAEWGIFYNGQSRRERQRFTVAHELGHLVLHRHQQGSFNCDKESIHAGPVGQGPLEREANDFASSLLMPGDVLHDHLSGRWIDLHLLSSLATRLEVSFEALCIRFIQTTNQRAILLRWDGGMLNYERRSQSAVDSRALIRRTAEPQEPLPGTVAAESGVEQEWRGVVVPASLWCADELPHMMLRELKHSYAERDRVLTLLLLDAAVPPVLRDGRNEERVGETFDRFVEHGQLPQR